MERGREKLQVGAQLSEELCCETIVSGEGLFNLLELKIVPFEFLGQFHWAGKGAAGFL